MSAIVLALETGAIALGDEVARPTENTAGVVSATTTHAHKANNKSVSMTRYPRKHGLVATYV